MFRPRAAESLVGSSRSENIVVPLRKDARRMQTSSRKFVRGMLTSICKITRSKLRVHSEVELEMALQLDLGGSNIPQFLKEYFISFNLRRATLCQQYFQRLRNLDDYDATDGAAIGEAFVFTTIKSEVFANSKLSKHQVSS